MATGLLALLDDVASIAKVAAASLDDVAGQAAKAGTKSVGVVIDDTAVTPRYVVGFSAARELPIVLRIARGSLRNKLLILVPVALLLSLLLPAVLTPLLMFGGAYLCYEGAEKLLAALMPDHAHAHEEEVGLGDGDSQALEDRKVASAVRTDFILSAEIVAIALGTIPDIGLLNQALVLVTVSIAFTVGVYGLVALVVKADDAGVALARQKGDAFAGRAIRWLGRGIVGVMPRVLIGLAVVGTAAMLWVGGGIFVHGLEAYGFGAPAHQIHALADAVSHSIAVAPAVFGWLTSALLTGVLGVLIGALVIPLVSHGIAPLWRKVAVRKA